MKTKHTINIEKEIEIEVEVSDVGLHLDKDGICAMISLDGAEEFNEEKFQFTWEEVLDWAQASSQDEGDSEAISAGLKWVADKLDQWRESFD